MSFKIIDSHMHMGVSPDYMVYDREMKSLLELMDRLEIEKGISTHMLSLKDQFALGASLDAEAYRKSDGRLFGFFAFGPHHPQAALDVMNAHRGDPIFKGIKIHPSGAGVDADSEAYRPAWEAAREFKIPILAHTWSISAYNPNQKSAFTGKFEKYISEYPDVHFVFGHSGGRYEGIIEAVRIGKLYKNCSFDIAGDIWGRGVLEYLVDNLGADRVIYGSDCYMIEQRPMLGVILGSGLSGAQKEKILRYNAARVYFKEE